MIRHIARQMVCLIPRGLTLTNSALITKTALTCDSHISIECKNMITSACDIYELVSMGMAYGDPVSVSACGKDAEETLNSIGFLLTEDALNPVHADIFMTALA